IPSRDTSVWASRMISCRPTRAPAPRCLARWLSARKKTNLYFHAVVEPSRHEASKLPSHAKVRKPTSRRSHDPARQEASNSPSHARSAVAQPPSYSPSRLVLNADVTIPQIEVRAESKRADVRSDDEVGGHLHQLDVDPHGVVAIVHQVLPQFAGF